MDSVRVLSWRCVVCVRGPGREGGVRLTVAAVGKLVSPARKAGAGRVWVWAALVAIGAVVVAHAVYLSCVAEDAFITFRFAQNLAAGHGLVWNVGEPPVEGYTNFLWVLLAAVALKLGLDPGLVAQVVGTAATLWIAIEVWRFARWLHPVGPVWVDLIAPTLVAFSGPMATWATSGMETNLFAALITAAVLRYTVGIGLKRLRLDVPILLFLAGLTRPEGVLVFLVLASHVVYLLGKAPERRRERARFLAWLLCFLVPGFVYFVWRLSYFGYLLPNTFYAKGGGSLHQARRGLIYVALFGRVYLAPMMLLVPAWGWLAWRRGRGRGSGLGNTEVGAGGVYDGWAWPMGLVLVAYLVYVVHVGGDYMAMFRFMVPVVPLIYLMIQEMVRLLVREVPRVRGATLAWLVVMAVWTAFPTMTRAQMRELGMPDWVVEFYRKPRFMHGYADGVNLERWHAARLTVLGKFFGWYARSPDDAVLTKAIGAISYYSGIRVYGEHGLVDTHIAHLDVPGVGRGLPGHEKGDYVYLLEKQPTFVMVNRDLTPRPMARSSLLRGRPSWQHPYFDHYVVVSAMIRDRQNHAQGYFNFFVLEGHVRRMNVSIFDPTSPRRPVR